LQRKGRVLDAMSDSLGALRRRFNRQDQTLLDKLNETTTKLVGLVLEGAQDATPDERARAIKALEDEREKLEGEISRRSAGFYERRTSLTLASLQAAMPRDAALVEFAVHRPISPKAYEFITDRSLDPNAVGEPRYVVYVVRTNGAARGVDLGAAKEIDAAVELYRQALRDPQRKDTRRLARELDEKVMRPALALAGDATRLLVSPDGALNLIPFAALADEEGRYLVERYSITYLTSGRDLLRRQAARGGGGRPLVVADPSFGEPVAEQVAGAVSLRKPATRGDRRRSMTEARDLSEVYFAPLGGTAREASAIRALFPDSDLLTGAQATEAAFKHVSAPRVLHVATHGFFLQDAKAVGTDNLQVATRGLNAKTKIENPLLRSGLALADANLRGRGASGADDGILTALEASGLNLWGTKLVVLSACDTGIGEVRNGEGVYGLRRAFALAGAESLVMSLWPASDNSTRKLMADYYSNLKRGLGRGESLRQVQLDLLRNNPRLHPFYWANFIQSGEWANLDGKR
jgi:CHAT domain-containing protein